MKQINGLILAGGYSSRMGMDKSKIDYHGMPQYAYFHGILKPMVDEVYISCRKEQSFEIPIPRIEDVYQDIGPMSGVISAFEFDAQCAWLVVAVDLPYVNEHVLSELLSHRDPLCDATYFVDPDSAMIEPLLTVYEPSIFVLLKMAHGELQFSLNKLLQGCGGIRVEVKDSNVVKSVNTPDEYEALKRFLPRKENEERF